jgi:hypothetical protein
VTSQHASPALRGLCRVSSRMVQRDPGPPWPPAWTSWVGQACMAQQAPRSQEGPPPQETEARTRKPPTEEAQAGVWPGLSDTKQCHSPSAGLLVRNFLSCLSLLIAKMVIRIEPPLVRCRAKHLPKCPWQSHRCPPLLPRDQGYLTAR